MKKVISALTVAAMCASMAASAVPAFAVYKAGDVSSYLKVIDAGKGTVSDDGKTVTFASAADAAGSKIVVGQYLVCDTANVSVQQISGLYTTDTTKIKLGNKGMGVDYSNPVGEAKEYTIGENTFTTDMFVNCFSYYTKKTKKFDTGNGNVSWGHSDDWQGDGWVGNGDNDVLMLQWATNFKDKINHPDDYKETAHFITDKSDDYPLTQFDVNFDSGIGNGTYSVDFLASYTHPEYGKKAGNWINVDGKNTIEITDTKGITIKIGDSSTPAPTDPQPTDPAVTPTDPQPTDPVVTPTEPSNPGQDISSIKEWTWVVQDCEYVLGSEDSPVINIISAGPDPGIFGYDFNIKTGGKTLDEAGFMILDISQGDAYNFTTFQPNVENGHVGATETNKEVTGDSKAEAGKTIVSYMVDVPEGAKVGDKYVIEIVDASAGNYNKDALAPKVMTGTLTITDGSTPTPTDPTPTDPQPTAPQPTDPQPTDPQPTSEVTPPSGDYLYGDVNEDGKVELVDVVKLNRYLTGLDADITATATVNANCFRAAGESDADTKVSNLDGKDSMEILKCLIGLVKQSDLPTKA